MARSLGTIAADQEKSQGDKGYNNASRVFQHSGSALTPQKLDVILLVYLMQVPSCLWSVGSRTPKNN